MVSIVNGLFASTIWRVMGGNDTRSGGCDTTPGGRPGGQSKLKQIMSDLNTPRARFMRKSVGHAQNLGSLKSGTHFNRHDLKLHNGMSCEEKDIDPDWVICDLPSVSAVPCVKSDQPLGAPSPSMLSSSKTSSEKVTSSSSASTVDIKYKKNVLEFDLNRFSLFNSLKKPGNPKMPSLSDNNNKDLPNQEINSKDIDKDVSRSTGILNKQPKITEGFDITPGDEVKASSTRTCSETTTIASIAASDDAATAITASANITTAAPYTAGAILATPGNYGGSKGRDASPKQCVSDGRVSNLGTWTGCSVNCHARVMATPNLTKEKDMEEVTTSQTLSGKVEAPVEPINDSLTSPIVSCQGGNNIGMESTTVGVTESGGGVQSSHFESSTNQAGFGSVSVRPAVPSVSPVVGYREDIRAYDIYRITPNQSPDAHYSRLPSALPTLTDSDSDPDDARWKQGIRKRKRRISGRKGGEGEGGKRYREGEESDDEDESVGLDDITIYSSPSIEDYTNRISILHRLSSNVEIQQSSSSSGNAPRRVSFSPSTSTLHHHHSNTSSTTPNTMSHTPTIPPSKPNPITTPLRKYGGDDESSDDGNSSNDDNNDDDDDDEASTVVPDDFDDETDSDIEVLAQSESWVDLSNQPEAGPDRVTPLPFGNGEETIRLLREAQKESNHSSARVSLASSRRDTPRDSPHDSPKSPPNSPNTELTTDPEEAILKGVYINYYNKEGDFIRVEKNTETDWIWDWSSRPDQSPPKEWRFSHPGKGAKRGASIRRVMVGKSSLFSRDVLYTLLITNVLSLLIGTGIGIWLSKRSSTGAIVTLPIN